MPIQSEFIKMTVIELKSLYSRLADKWNFSIEKKLQIIDRILEINPS